MRIVDIDWDLVCNYTERRDLKSIPYQCPKCYEQLSRLGYRKDTNWHTKGLICPKCEQIFLKEGIIHGNANV
jgi:hypothetical protein